LSEHVAAIAAERMTRTAACDRFNVAAFGTLQREVLTQSCRSLTGSACETAMPMRVALCRATTPEKLADRLLIIV
jgi:hypothetical protein